MFRLTLSKHQEVCKDLTHLLSGLLPHENKDLDNYAVLLNSITKLIRIEEMEVEYYLVFKIAKQILDISLDTDTLPLFSRQILETILDSELYTAIVNDGRGFARMAEQEGLSSDFSVEINVQAAATIAKQRAMELYDEAFSLALSSIVQAPEEDSVLPDDGDGIPGVMGYLLSLRNNYALAVGSEFISLQSAFLNGDNSVIQTRRGEGWYEFFRKNKYKEPNGWVEFGQHFFSMLDQRLREASVELKPLESIHEAEALKDDLLRKLEVIAEYGIAPIDAGTPIKKVRYSVLIGKPNLGKTTIAMNWAVNVLLEGKKVAVFSGENAKSAIFYEYLLPAYVYKKYGFFVTSEQVLGQEEVGGTSQEEIEERKMLIKLATCELAESGNFLFVETLSASQMKEDLAALYEIFPFDYIVIDHTLALAGEGGNTERLEKMSRDLVEFRNEYETSILLLSHPSPDAKKIVSRQGAEGLVKYCKQIEGDADDIFFLFDTEELEANKILAMMQIKGRGASKVLDIIYLTKLFEYKIFRYDAAIQPASLSSSETVDALPFGEDDDSDGDDSLLSTTLIEF